MTNWFTSHMARSFRANFRNAVRNAKVAEHKGDIFDKEAQRLADNAAANLKAIFQNERGLI